MTRAGLKATRGSTRVHVLSPLGRRDPTCMHRGGGTSGSNAKEGTGPTSAAPQTTLRLSSYSPVL